ncbi:MAG: PASTA domain-containing protein [Lachnospirales bacterium]
MTRCLGCMAEYEDGLSKCPHCGYINDSKPKEVYHITPGSILEGRYIVGRVVGQGGFGITYVGWDLQLSRKVAIKEYFPSDFATRALGKQSLTIYAGEAGEQFASGLKSFIDEAQRLAKFNGIKGVVDIYDTFISNNTGYIVMEFLSGISIKDMLKANTVLDYPTAKEVVVEMLYILKEVHSDNIIHRDIAPDNIFITDSGEFKLLDFGAARYATTVHSKSLSVILKPGYAPEEQYRSHGNQGPWTDIYALAATFYKMITGITPPESMERRTGDNLVPPSKLGVTMPKNDEITLLNALNILPENRIQSAQEMLDALGGKKMTRKKERNLTTDTGKMFKFVIPMLGTAVFLIVGFFLLIYTGIIDTQYWGEKFKTEIDLPDGYALVNNVVGMQNDNAKKILEGKGFKVIEGEALYSDTVEEGLVAAQTPGTGAEKTDSEIMIIVSKGAKMAQINTLISRNVNEVVNELKAMGFYNVQVQSGTENKLQKNTIESANIDENKSYKLSEPIILKTSDGTNFKIDATKDVDLPNWVGSKIDSVRSKVSSLKLGMSIRYDYSNSYDEGRIISQSPAGGKIKEGSTISFVVSKGKEPESRIPNVTRSSISSARAELSAAGYGSSVSYVYDNNIAANIVISQSPSGGTVARKGTNVSLVVSKGHEPTTVITEKPIERTTSRPIERTTVKPVERTTAAPLPLTISPSSVKVTVGKSTSVSGSSPIQYGVSSNTRVADVSGNKITGISAGTATVTFTSNDGRRASVSVTVTSPDPEPTTEQTTKRPEPIEDASISVSPSSVTIQKGSSTYVNINISGNSSKYDVITVSSSKKIVADGANIKANDSGNAIITYKLVLKNSPSKVLDTATVNVNVPISDSEREEIKKERKRQIQEDEIDRQRNE